jgi:hypothetical protein
MWRPGLEVVGTIVLLELLARGGVKGGQNQGKVGDLTATGVIGGPGLELHSANPRHLGTLPYSHLSSGVGGQAGVVAGIRNQPLELKRSRNRRSPLLIGLYISQRVLQALDAQSTVRALHAGSAQDGNPLVRPSASQSAALVVFKLALSTESTGCTNLIPGWR